MKLSVIIPVFNEEATIAQVLKKLIGVSLSWEKEIIIVNDGSTDKTLAVINRFCSRLKNKKLIKIISLASNSGKGKGLAFGMKKAGGDYILIQDADLEYDPEDIPLLIKQADKKTAVFGNRFARSKIDMPLLYRFGNKFLTFLTNFFYRTHLNDMETGYKLLPAKFIKNISLSASRFDIEPEITVKLIKENYSIKELPISYHGRTHLAGKKLTITDAAGALKTILFYRFPKWDIFLLTVFLFLMFLVYSVIAVSSHNHFQTFGWDLGYFDQIIWKLSNFIYPFSTLNNVNFIANHFSPILLINALLYKFWSDPRMLLISQAFFIILSALPLYLLSKEKTRSLFFSFAVVFSFIFFLGTQWSILNEFHEATYAPFFLALFFYAANSEIRKDLLLASIIGLLFTKEEFALMTASLSFPLYFIYKQKKQALILFATSILFFFFLTEIFMPAMSEKGIYQHAHLSVYAKTPLELITLLINKPALILGSLISPPQKINTLIISFASFAFMPLLAPLSVLAPTAEQFLMRFLYSGPQFTVFANVNHHAAPIAVLLPIAVIFAVERIVNKFPQFQYKILISASILLIASTSLQDILLKAPIHSIFKSALLRDEEWMRDARFIIANVPANAKVATQNSLIPHLSQRNGIYLLPEFRNADYIALDFHDGANKFAPLDRSLTRNLVADLLKNGQYQIIVSQGEAFLLKRTD